MRLIDIDEVKRTYTKDMFDTIDDFERVNDILDYAETVDAVKVVRCKNCKKGHIVPDFDGLYSCNWKRKPLHDPDDFCNFGIKREDG